MHPNHPQVRPVDPTLATAPALRLLFWESTAGCNLACIHCRRLDVNRTITNDDLTTEQAVAMIRSLPETGRPILVFSGGEPLMRPDIFELAQEARLVGLPAAVATNGTIMNEEVADKIVASGIERVSISFDGPDAPTHDFFRGQGAFDSSIAGFRALRERGMSMQMNTTVAKHNYRKLDQMYRLALDMGADALHIFMLVPVGCGMELSPEIMLDDAEYEDALNWIYDRSLEGRLHLKATCAPHYFRVMKQRTRASGHAMPAHAHPHKNMGTPQGRPGGHPTGNMTAMTKGCLAGQSVCFVSHTGEVFPCGYLPVSSGNVKVQGLPAIWRDSRVFADLRDETKLEGKCGLCEYKRVCMGCRARAYGTVGNYLAEEPNCNFVPLRIQRRDATHVFGAH